MNVPVKILMVDDEDDFRTPMAFWFKTKGYDVATAENGEKALEAINANKPDIVFLDLNMPIMDGFETLKRIRNIDKHLPVIIISAYADPQKIKEIQPYEISGVFYKGSDFEEGLSLIETVLRTHKKLKK